MHSWDIFEGRDNPIIMERLKFETINNMKIVRLIILLTRLIWRTRKAVSMYISLCVLKGTLEMRKRGVYGIGLIKKRHYWPRGVHIDGIND